MQITRVEGDTVFMTIPLSSSTKEGSTTEVYARKDEFTSWYISVPGTYYQHNNDTGHIDIVEDSHKRKGSKRVNVGKLNKTRDKEESIIMKCDDIKAYNKELFTTVGVGHLPEVDDLHTLPEINLAIGSCLDLMAKAFITDQFKGDKAVELQYLEVLGGIYTLYTAKKRILKLEQDIK